MTVDPKRNTPTLLIVGVFLLTQCAPFSLTGSPDVSRACIILVAAKKTLTMMTPTFKPSITIKTGSIVAVSDST